MAEIIFSEGSGLQDSIYGKSQAPIRMFIEKKGEAFEQMSFLPKLFNMGKSNHYGEKFTAMTAMEGFQPVGENGLHPDDSMQESYSKTLEHMTWKNSFAISREMVEDSKLMDLKNKPSAFVTGYYRTREKFGAALFGGAITGSKTITFGGKSFDSSSADGLGVFDEAHTSKISGKGTQSNSFSDAFSVDALAAAECAMQNFKGDNGEILDVSPNTIVIPNIYTLKKSVFEVIGADKDPATANNGFNYQFGRWNVVVLPYLNEYVTGAPWILLDSRYNQDHGGAVWLDRTPLDVKSRIDDDTDANIWQGYARFTAGFNDWRFACCGGITGGTALIG